MLKIKDDVDLNELKKFNLIHRIKDECYGYEYETEETFNYLLIFERNRKIYGNEHNIIYDLIQAELVEKVEE